MAKKIVKTVPTWAQVQPQEAPGAIHWPGIPFQYRADGLKGQFWCGSTQIGSRLTIIPFDYRIKSEQRWDFPCQTWLDLAFIDDKLRPAILPLKKDGILNLISCLHELTAEGIAIMGMRLTLELKEQESADGQPYYVVDLVDSTFHDEQTYLKVLEFAERGVFEWILVGEIEG